jgi:hypothetical protein
MPRKQTTPSCGPFHIAIQTKMKTLNLLPLLLLLSLPAVVQAQFSFTVNNDGSLNVSHCTNYNAVVVAIPATVNGLAVTSIGVFAFDGCSNLASVTIPDSVTSIGSYAFPDCSRLTSVNIGANVASIGANSFAGCTNLPSVTIPGSVTSIGGYAFSDCNSLTNVTITNGVASIGDYAFVGCTSLPGVTIPASVTSIGETAFYNSTNLTAANFQGNAPPDNGSAFAGDSRATVYYLPGATGWGATFGSRPTALWTLPYPVILGGANGSTNLGVQNNRFGFKVSWATNVPVVVLAATNLANPVWTPVATNSLTNGAFYFNDPKWTNYPGRFYRLRSP